jgi:hypothetical protein
MLVVVQMCNSLCVAAPTLVMLCGAEYHWQGSVWAAVVRQSTQWSCKVACLMHAVVTAQVVIDAFRLINPQTMMLGQEPRQTTSNLGHLEKPSIQVTS